MIKLKNLIQESQQFDASVIDRLKTDFSEVTNLFLKHDLRLYRGELRGNDVMIKTPSTKYRLSTTDTIPNYFQVICDSFWPNELQKRSNSIFFTGDRHDATQYGDLFYIFPINGARITFGSGSDNWYNYAQNMKKFYVSEISLKKFGGAIYDLCQLIDVKMTNWKSKNLNDARFDFSEIDSKIKNMDIDKIKMKGNPQDLPMWLIESILKSNGIENLLKAIFDPVGAGLKTVNVSDINKYMRGGVEMWTESECMLITTKINVEKYLLI